MLKTLIFVVIMATALAGKIPKPDMHVTFDGVDDKPLSAVGDPYSLFFRGEKNVTYVPSPINEGLALNGEYYLEAAGNKVATDCITDVELCEDGFAASIWIKREKGWSSGGAQYIVSLGEGEGKPYGTKISMRRRTLFFEVYGNYKYQKIECKLPEDHPTDGWMHLVLNGRSVDKLIVPFWNGDKMKDCKNEEEELKERKNPPESTFTHILVGARQDPVTEYLVGFFEGVVDDFRVYTRHLEIPEIRDIYREGKDFLKEENTIA